MCVYVYIYIYIYIYIYRPPGSSQVHGRVNLKPMFSRAVQYSARQNTNCRRARPSGILVYGSVSPNVSSYRNADFKLVRWPSPQTFYDVGRYCADTSDMKLLFVIMYLCYLLV